MVPKCQSFVNVYKVENVNAGGLNSRWSKSQNLVTVICKSPLMIKITERYNSKLGYSRDSFSLSCFIKRSGPKSGQKVWAEKKSLAFSIKYSFLIKII